MITSACLRCVAALMLLIIIFVNKSDCLKCYSASGASHGSFSSDDAEIVDGCSSCTKILIEGRTTRGCSESVGGAEVCDPASTVTACYCKTDLCNAGSKVGVTMTLVTVAFSALKLFL